MFRNAGVAPYLDFRPASDNEKTELQVSLDAEWLRTDDWEHKAIGFALNTVVPKHFQEVRERRLPLLEKVEQEVKARLTKEINH